MVCSVPWNITLERNGEKTGVHEEWCSNHLETKTQTYNWTFYSKVVAHATCFWQSFYLVPRYDGYCGNVSSTLYSILQLRHSDLGARALASLADHHDKTR